MAHYSTEECRLPSFTASPGHTLARASCLLNPAIPGLSHRSTAQWAESWPEAAPHPGLSSARCANLRSWKSCKTSAKSPPRAVQWSMCVVVCPLWRRCVIVNWLSSLWHQVSSIRYERLHKLNTSIVDFVTNVRVSPPKNENVKGLYPRV